MATKDIPDPASGGWHFDRRVPLALMTTMLIQTAAIVWWAASLDTRVEHLEEAAKNDSEVVQRVTKVETKVSSIERTLGRIDGKLDRLIERRYPPRSGSLP